MRPITATLTRNRVPALLIAAAIAVGALALAATSVWAGNGCTLEAWSESDPSPGTSTSTQEVLETVFLRGSYPGDDEVVEEALLDSDVVNVTRHNPDASGAFEVEWFATEQGVTYTLRVTGAQTDCVQQVEVMLVVAGASAAPTAPDTAASDRRVAPSPTAMTAVGLVLILAAACWVATFRLRRT
jgi:hypothetical protein